MFALGQKVRCMVTGFTGIAIGKSEWLNGCVQYLVKPPVDKDGKDVEGRWIDVGQLELVDEGITARRQAPALVGGPVSQAPPTEYRG